MSHGTKGLCRRGYTTTSHINFSADMSPFSKAEEFPITHLLPTICHPARHRYTAQRIHSLLGSWAEGSQYHGDGMPLSPLYVWWALHTEGLSQREQAKLWDFYWGWGEELVCIVIACCHHVSTHIHYLRNSKRKEGTLLNTWMEEVEISCKDWWERQDPEFTQWLSLALEPLEWVWFWEPLGWAELIWSIFEDLR